MPQHLITLISHDISNGIQQTQHMQLQQASQAAAAPSTCRRRSQHNTQQQPGPATAAAAPLAGGMISCMWAGRHSEGTTVHMHTCCPHVQCWDLYTCASLQQQWAAWHAWLAQADM